MTNVKKHMSLGFITMPMSRPKKCTTQQIESGECFDDNPNSRRVRVDDVRPCANEKKCYKIVLSVRGKRRKEQLQTYEHYDENYDEHYEHY